MTEENLVTLKIDGKEISVPQGTLIIRAAEELGIHIPRFCDHPLLKPVAACRQCLVEVAMPDREGVVRPMPKPQPSCAMTVMPNMEVKTQLSSEVSRKAQEGVMEFILLNHPLDCPICDKAGQCPLQDHSYQVGRTQSRFVDEKRVKEKPVSLTNQILLDRERCILCQRCVRFAKEIPGDAFIDLQLRGSKEEIGRFAPSSAGDFMLPCEKADENVFDTQNLNLDTISKSGENFASYFTGNIIDICPVGALTSKKYRFKARPFDLVSHETISEFDASGSSLTVDIRNNKVLRRNAGQNPDINESWINDKERFGYTWQNDTKRITKPLIDGEIATWGSVYQKLETLLETNIGFLPGGCLTIEDSYAWSKFARIIGKTNAIDFRYRTTDINEEAFIYNNKVFAEKTVEYKDLETAKNIVLLDFEPEEECTSVFLKLYKNVQNNMAKVYVSNPFLSPGNTKLKAELLPYKVCGQKDTLQNLLANKQLPLEEFSVENTIVIAGEKASAYLKEAKEFAEKINAKFVFIPRRISEGSGYRYGLTPNLLPNAISVQDEKACDELANIWQTTLPNDSYNGYEEILDKVISGQIQTLFVGGVDIHDYPNQEKIRLALEKATVVSLEVRESEITKLADIVLPVAPPSEKNGTYINWCSNKLPFGQLFTTTHMSDREILNTLAEIKGVNLGLQNLNATHNEIQEVEKITRNLEQLEYKENKIKTSEHLEENTFLLSTSKTLIDDGVKISDNKELQKGTRLSVARLSKTSAEKIGVQTGDIIQITKYFDTSNDTCVENGQKLENTIVLPVQITQMAEEIIWVPQNTSESKPYITLGADTGTKVFVQKTTEPNSFMKVLEEENV